METTDELLNMESDAISKILVNLQKLTIRFNGEIFPYFTEFISAVVAGKCEVGKD